MTLKELYEKIKNLNPLPLVPGVFSEGNIFSYYSSACEAGDFTINDPVVTMETDVKGNLIKVLVQGNTDSYALGNSVPVSLAFTIQLGNVYVESVANMQGQTLAIPGISWFNISDVAFWASIYEANMTTGGALKGKISLLPNVTFAMDYPVQAATWVLNATLDTPARLSDLVALCGGADLIGSLPPPMKTFLDLGVEATGISYNSDTSTLEYISLTIGSQTAWRILPMLSLESIRLKATVLLPGSKNTKVNYTITGNFQIGQKGTTNGLISISAAMPNLQIYGGLEPGSVLYLKDLLGLFIPGVTTTGFDSKFTAFKFLADPANSNYNLDGTLETSWKLITIGATHIVLQSITANLQYLNGNTTGGLSGVIELQPAQSEEAAVVIQVSAEHPVSGDGWLFSGSLADGSQLDVKKLLDNFLGFEVLPAGSKITITSLAASFHSKSNDYSFGVSVDWGNILGNDIPITVSDTTLYITSKGGTRSGYIAGTADFAGVSLQLTYTFSQDPKQANNLTFVIFGITSTINTGEPPYVLTIQPKGKSVGDIITFLINAARPGSGISLPAPWDVLNTILLDGFTFSVDFTNKKVGFTYAINTNLGFVNITNISLYYTFEPTKKVEIALAGSFLGQPMPAPWNTLDPTAAPTVPGKGNNKFDLKFVGLGQRVGINLPLPGSVKAGVDNMVTAFVQPPEKGSVLVFDPSVNWLVGARFTLLNMINIDALFYDPLLYGLSINVTSGKFNNLKFEILYKKVNNNIGVYQIFLALPDFIRQMEFGALSITLPNIAIWIYTNGDFKLDFGFPANGNFAGSFGVQFLPFVGAGGFYFGVLSTQTASQLPADYNPSTGDFDPVIVFGVGLRIGIGKSVNKGILKAELSLNLQGIIEGTIAFFNAYPPPKALLPANDLLPALQNSDRPVYYYIQGQIAIVGKIAGEINFAIISASLDITVTISARAVIEAYQATLINFTAGVSVSLKVSINLGIFSISIRLSFNATISESFTLGSYDPNAPWARGSKLRAARRPVLLSLTDDNTCLAIPDMNWQPIYADPANNDLPVKVELYFASQFTVTSDTLPTGSAAAKNPRGVAMLYIRSSSLLEEEVPPFTKLARGVLTWVFNAFYNKDLTHPTEKEVLDKTVTAEDLQAMYCYLSQNTFNGAAHPFTYEQVINFLSNYFEFSVVLAPAAAGNTGPETSVFPVFPLLSLVTPSGEVDFGENASIRFTVEELNLIKRYFSELSGGNADTSVVGMALETKESLAHYIFLDYFTMLAKATVQDAIDKMKLLPQEVPAGKTLGELVQLYPHSGIDAAELAFSNRMKKVNPGTELLIRRGSGDTHTPAGLRHTIIQDENLRSIAGRYKISVQELALNNLDVVDVFMPGRRIVFPQVASINAGELLNIMVQQFVFEHIAGLSARVLLQGLRPPSPEESVYKGVPAAFYALSLQLFDAAALTPNENITLKITGEQELPWLTLNNGISIDMPVSEAIVTFLNGLRSAPFAPVINELTPLPLAGLRPKNFTLATQIAWKNPDATVSEPSIWPLSTELVSLLQSGKQPLPALTLYTQVQENFNSGTEPVVVPNPEWCLLLDVKVKRVAGTDKTIYELMGTGQAGSSLLENLLIYYSNKKTAFVNAISLLYAPAPAGAGQTAPPAGLQSAPASDVSLFIAQSNLSTVSNPPMQLAEDQRLAIAGGLVGQTPIDFLKLLWECSITGTGGFYLYYSVAPDGATLPDHLFNENPVATVTLLAQLDVLDGLPGFVNAVTITETIDTANEVLFAQASFVQTTHTMAEDETLQGLKKKYYTDIYTIARQNASALLTSDHELQIPARNYRAPQTGGQVFFTAATHKNETPVSLQTLASQYNISTAALLHANSHIPALFVSPLTFDNSIEEKICLVPPGHTGFYLSRQNPGQTKDPNQQQLLELYNLLEYYISGQGIFNASNPAIPAGPSDKPDEAYLYDIDRSFAPPAVSTGDWTYQGVFPVYPFVKNIPPFVPGFPDPANNPYRAIYGEAMQAVAIGFGWNDIFGNTLAVDSEQAAAGTWPQLSIQLGYTDELIAVSQWRNVLPGYVVRLENGTQALVIHFTFLADRYTGITDPDARIKNAKADGALYTSIYYQLVQADATIAVSSSMDGPEAIAFTQDPKSVLLQYLGAIYTFLEAVAENNANPPIPQNVSISWPIADLNPANVFKLTVSLTINRKLQLVADEFKDQLSCSTATTAIKPDLAEIQPALADDEPAPLSLKAFATDFQSAFPKLKVLTGPPPVNTTEDEIWIARFSKDNTGIWLSVIDAGTPYYYAVKPLSVNLLSNPGMTVFRYVTGEFIGNSGTQVKAFNSVDVELQAAAFLSAVDLFLSPNYVVNDWLIENSTASSAPDSGAIIPPKSPYNTLIQAKKDLAQAISKHLEPIFTSPAPGSDRTGKAQEALKQELLIQLSNAYSINTVVQFPTCVQANMGLPANLYGKPVDTVTAVTGAVNPTAVPYSLSSSKVPLPQSPAQSCLGQTTGNEDLTFMFSATNPDENPYMVLPLNYVISAMEINIKAVPGIEGYTASDWLSFVLPFEVNELSTSLGTLTIPVPLRAYPTPPSVLVQEAAPALPQSRNLAKTPLTSENELEQLKQWNYSYTYDYRGAGQDTIGASVTSNLGQSKFISAKDDVTDPDLFTALMQFADAYPAIQSDLNTYLLQQGDKEKALTAMQSFAWLVNRVAAAWKTWTADRLTYTASLTGTNPYHFNIGQSAYTPPVPLPGKAPFLMVCVSPEDTSTALPVIDINGYHTETQPVMPACGGQAYLYTDDKGDYLSYNEGIGITQRTVQLPAPFDILKEENASGGISIIRNLNLGAGRTVVNDFIYRTPLIRLINPATPHLHPSKKIDLAFFSPPGSHPLALFLSNFLEALFGEIESTVPVARKITWGTAYSYNLVNTPAADAITITLPVLLTTPYDLNIPADWDVNNTNSFVSVIAKKIIAWFNTPNNPNTYQGAFNFQLSLYSYLTDSNLPVLTLDTLTLSIDVISDLVEK